MMRHETKAKQAEPEAHLEKIPRCLAFSTWCGRVCLLDKCDLKKYRDTLKGLTKLLNTIQSLKIAHIEMGS